MNDKYILDANGNPQPCDLETWAKWFEKAQRHVAIDNIGKVVVSTIFLGLDHSFGQGKPVLWETMIFGGPHDQYMDRYTSKEEAIAGHAKAVAMVKAG